MRPVYPEIYSDTKGSPDAASPVHLTTQPEFLPPKPMAEVEKEKEQVRPTSTASRRDNWDTQDEVQTLPSWRGQYRKKRYPPI